MYRLIMYISNVSTYAVRYVLVNMKCACICSPHVRVYRAVNKSIGTVRFCMLWHQQYSFVPANDCVVWKGCC